MLSLRRRGWTLVEMVVVSSLAILMVVVLTTIHSRFQHQSQEPLELADQELTGQRLLQSLQRELLETNLQSLRSLQNGFSCESARDFQDALHFNDFGTVSWQKFVRYQVEGGQLVLDQTDTGLALEPTQPPDYFPPDPKIHRVLAHNLDTLKVGYHDATGDHPFTASGRGEPVMLALNLKSTNPHTGRSTVTHLQTSVKPRN